MELTGRTCLSARGRGKDGAGWARELGRVGRCGREEKEEMSWARKGKWAAGREIRPEIQNPNFNIFRFTGITRIQIDF